MTGRLRRRILACMPFPFSRTPIDRDAPPKKFALGLVYELIQVVAISLAIIIPVRYFLVQPFYVKGASMEDGRREPFNRLKIFNGLKRACEKRPISINVIEKIVNRLELHFQERGEREVKSSDIGERVMEELHRLDGVAYVRFASVYRQFKDIQEFIDELKDLLGNREEAKKK